jgi:hypothetical protein
MHGLEIAMKILTSNTMGYPIPWAHKITVNPTIIKSKTL